MGNRKWAAIGACLTGILLIGCRATGGTEGSGGIAAQSVQSTANTVEYDGVPYTASGTPELMDILSPKPGPGRLPVIVCIHGGSWTYGNRGDMRGALTWLASQGYCACSIDYRLSQDAPFPAQIQDCKCAVRYLRAHADVLHLDPNRIGVLGLSAGAHLGLLLGLTPTVSQFEGTGGWPQESSKVQCVMDLEGPTDFTPLLGKVTLSPDTRAVLEKLFGGPLETHHQAATDASPITYVKRGEPPILIMQGDQDTLVPLSQSQTLYDRLKASGDDVTLKVIPGIGHGPLEEFSAPDNVALAQGFFDRVLKSTK